MRSFADLVLKRLATFFSRLDFCEASAKVVHLPLDMGPARLKPLLGALLTGQMLRDKVLMNLLPKGLILLIGAGYGILRDSPTICTIVRLQIGPNLYHACAWSLARREEETEVLR